MTEVLNHLQQTVLLLMFVPPWQKNENGHLILHKIGTLFLSRNIMRLARWRGWPQLRIALHQSAIKLDFSISHDLNSVLILCIIQVAVFVFWPG